MNNLLEAVFLIAAWAIACLVVFVPRWLKKRLWVATQEARLQERGRIVTVLQAWAFERSMVPHIRDLPYYTGFTEGLLCAVKRIEDPHWIPQE